MFYKFYKYIISDILFEHANLSRQGANKIKYLIELDFFLGVMALKVTILSITTLHTMTIIKVGLIVTDSMG
jgi:hypothetical protein